MSVNKPTEIQPVINKITAKSETNVVNSNVKSSIRLSISLLDKDLPTLTPGNTGHKNTHIQYRTQE